MDEKISAFAWIVAWIAFLALMALIARTEWGRKIIYYLAWLAVTFLIVTHAKDLTKIVEPITRGTSSVTIETQKSGGGSAGNF